MTTQPTWRARALLAVAALVLTSTGCSGEPSGATNETSESEQSSEPEAPPMTGDAVADESQADDTPAADNPSSTEGAPSHDPPSDDPPTNPAALDPTANPEQPVVHNNRLIDETSPYLLQHAHNPVDWYPWGDEAIQAARDQDKLIFLSVGYSTCYWCHVMERESFENEATAKVMNDLFISIKVDREERPDVDDIYMMSLRIMGQRGGWPMSVWIDPHTLQPVYGGTYFPGEAMIDGAGRTMRPSFTTVLEGISGAWSEQRVQMQQNGQMVADALQQELSASRPVVGLDQSIGIDAVGVLLDLFDPIHGGFGDAPKFPQPPYLELLLAGRDWVDAETREKIDSSLRYTLDHMAMGGMYDQVGGGFHRYSTDEKWLVPHFEKMLYDNGQLASLYARAADLFDDAYYRQIVQETLDYVLREMRDDGGAFYSAQDAEVNAREGQNYLWTPEQIKQTLTTAGHQDLAEFALEVYGLDAGTNFQDPHHQGEPPSNVLFLRQHPTSVAPHLGLTQEEFESRLVTINGALLAVRDTRDQPGTDDKVLTGWNGLMIAGFADGGRVLGDEKYIQAAREAADFVLSTMRTTDGGLLRSYRAGQARIDGFLADYAFFIHGLLALHRATGEDRWLDEARTLTAAADSRFGDPVNGNYYDTLTGQADLFVRSKTTYDGAVPSGNAVMLNNLIELNRLTNEQSYLDTASSLLSGNSSAIRGGAIGLCLSTVGMMTLASIDLNLLPQVTVDSPTGMLRGLTGLTVDAESVAITLDGSQLVTIMVDIDPEFHINAHEPGDDTLIGLLVHVVGGEGIVANVQYPEGDEYQQALRVHHGQVSIPVAFELIGEVTGEPRLAIRWQACTDSACLEPQEHTFDLAFDVQE